MICCLLSTNHSDNDSHRVLLAAYLFYCHIKHSQIVVLLWAVVLFSVRSEQELVKEMVDSDIELMKKNPNA